MTDLRRNGANLAAAERAARAEYVSRRLEQGATLTGIARELGLGAETLRQWWLSYQNGAPNNSKPGAKPDRQWRACVTCRADFRSQRAEGAWLRMCPPCRRDMTCAPVYGTAHDGRKGRAR